MERLKAVARMTIGAALAALSTVGCTVSSVDVPGLQGPSELGLSITLTVVPDILSLDGASQAQVTIVVRDAQGQPLANVTLRAEILAAGRIVDCGALSARTLATGDDGRAWLTYTAPQFPCDASGEVTLRFTPFGTDAANQIPRQVFIRLVEPGVILPGGPSPSFTINGSATLTALLPFVDVLFDGSGSTPAPGTAITLYRWDFGDGTTASGSTLFHRFQPGTYFVTLTATDTNGVSSSAARAVTVAAGIPPTATFVFSPTAPIIDQSVVFDASASRAATGRSIVEYDWHFGTGTRDRGVVVSKTYGTPGIYTVVLTVTDDVGQEGTATQTVSVGTVGAALTAAFTFSPSDPTAPATVNFNASGSTPLGSIVNFAWDFGDGGMSPTNTVPTTSHLYGAAGTYVVRLTVTDDEGRTATTTVSVAVS